MKRIRAIYSNGTFRPLEPVFCLEQERVVLTIENADGAKDDGLDNEFLAYVQTQADDAVSLEAVRTALAKIPGSLAGDVRADREQW
jgi:predicted DNA-binding antitoxin AbrB/MazE fold protein